MPTQDDVPVGSDPQEDEEEATICEYCGADLVWHRCPEGDRAERDRQL